jgi:hypothetical protein
MNLVGLRKINTHLYNATFRVLHIEGKEAEDIFA